MLSNGLRALNRGMSLVASAVREIVNDNFERCVTDIVPGEGVNIERIGGTVIVSADANGNDGDKDNDGDLYILTACAFDDNGNEQEPGTRVIRGSLFQFVGKVIQTEGDDRWWQVSRMESLVNVTSVRDDCPEAASEASEPSAPSVPPVSSSASEPPSASEPSVPSDPPSEDDMVEITALIDWFVDGLDIKGRTQTFRLPADQVDDPEDVTLHEGTDCD